MKAGALRCARHLSHLQGRKDALMKELGSSELKSLKDRITATQQGPRSPWPTASVRAGPSSSGGHLHDFAQPMPPAQPSNALPGMHGIERRLVRRAEALWLSLCDADALPPLAASAKLLAEPFGAQAALFRIPRPTRANPMPRPVPQLVGSRLEALGQGSGSTRSALLRRLTSLAADAHFDAEPAYYDSETECPGIRESRHGPALMVRAIALPLAPPPRGAACVVVIASWREILSAKDTRALQLELANAVQWMRSNGFSTPASSDRPVARGGHPSGPGSSARAHGPGCGLPFGLNP